MHYIERVLADELQQIPDALIVPCGEAVDDAPHDARCLEWRYSRNRLFAGDELLHVAPIVIALPGRPAPPKLMNTCKTPYSPPSKR